MYPNMTLVTKKMVTPRQIVLQRIFWPFRGTGHSDWDNAPSLCILAYF